MDKDKEKQLLGGYDLPEVETTDVEVADDPKQKKVPFHELAPLAKIRIAAESNGVIIKDPDPSCRKGCHGRGYISTSVMKTSSAEKGEEVYELPNPCKCIFRKNDIPKMFTGNILLNRKLRRKHDKIEFRDNLAKKKEVEIEKEKKRLLQLHREKNKKKRKALKKQKRRK